MFGISKTFKTMTNMIMNGGQYRFRITDAPEKYLGVFLIHNNLIEEPDLSIGLLHLIYIGHNVVEPVHML